MQFCMHSSAMLAIHVIGIKRAKGKMRITINMFLSAPAPWST